jgi:GDPmannose 4,6-dehydratase
MPNKVAIITGIRGMDAESLSYILLEKGYTVIGTYRKTTDFDENKVLEPFGNKPIHLSHCDIADKDSVRGLVIDTLVRYGTIDELYLLAAQSHVGNSFSCAEQTVQANGTSVYYFLEVLQELSPKTRTYFAATSELFGGDPNKIPFTEESQFELRSPYSIGKNLGVNWIKYFQMTYGMKCTYGILFNHSNCSRAKDFMIRRCTNAAARISLGKQKELALGNLNFYRDEHWSDFGAEMMWKMLQEETPDTYVICRGQCFHGEEFLDESFGYFNLNWRDYVVFDKSRLRANEVVKLVGSPKKAIEKLGWNPNRMSFKDHIGLMCKNDYSLEKDGKEIRPNVFDLYP